MAILKFNETQTCTYAIGIWQKNAQNMPTKYIEYETNDPADLAQWYEKHAFRLPRKHKSKVKIDNKNKEEK